MLHLIPDDDAPHAPSTECGCGPQLRFVTFGAYRREALVHTRDFADQPDMGDDPTDPTWEQP